MTRSSRSRARCLVPASLRPTLETLEDRLAPAVFTVIGIGDTGSGSGLTGDLRYCLNQADQLGGIDTIQFSSTLFTQPQTITLTSPLPSLMVNNLTVQGPGANLLTVSGNQAATILVASGTNETLSGLSLVNGTGTSGGALQNTGSLTLVNCLLSGNHASHAGGAIDNSGSLTLVNTSFTGNSANFYGGGIANYGYLTASNSTLSGNSSGFQGGGISNYGILSLTGSILSGNSSGQGGALKNTGVVAATNSTLANNSANFGAGVLNFNSLTLIDSTVSGNAAVVRGGGLYNQGNSALTLNNTLVAGNSGNTPDVYGVVNPASSFNLIGVGTGLSGISNGVNGNQIGTAASPLNPDLTALGNWGGPTQTLALLPGSPAIDHGSNALAQGATDQRGLGRIFGGTVDVGAVEYQGPLTAKVNSTADNTLADNVLTLREALASVQGILGRALTASEQAQVSGDPAGPIVVDFDPGLTSWGPASIALSATLPGVTVPNLTLQGPGAGLLTLNGKKTGAILITNGANETVSGLTLSNGYSFFGGAVQNYGSLTLAACTLSGNAALFGAGLYNHGTANVTNCSISNNYASIAAGALANAGTLTVTNSILSGNRSYGVASVRNGGNLTLSGSSLTGNTSSGDGSGFENVGTLTVINSTFTGNSARYGGGFFNQGNASLVNSTLSGNSALYGAGIDNPSGNPLLLNNTLVAGNVLLSGNPANGTDVFGNADPASSFNLIGNGTSLVGLTNGVNGNQIGTGMNPLNPLLSPLGNWGGPTPTFALLPGSPALAAGSSSINGLPSTDQRGDARTRNGTVDIGAFESQGFTLALTGSNQHATVAGAFANPLAVAVTSAFGEPVAGGVVTFLAPAAGASANLTSVMVQLDPSGQASVTASANTVAGAYLVTARVDPGASATAFNLTNDPGLATHFLVSAASPETAGKSFSVTVTAQDVYGNTATGYLGTLHFTSSDPHAHLPPTYSFVSGDGGQHVFSATLKTAGTQTLTATDSASITGHATVKVIPGTASHFVVSAPTSVTAGTSFGVTVTAEDAYGNVTPAFKSKVHFSSTDSKAVLPADYVFVAVDKGVHTFTGLVFKTVGSQTVTVIQANKASVKGTSAPILVTNPPSGPAFLPVGRKVDPGLAPPGASNLESGAAIAHDFLDSVFPLSHRSVDKVLLFSDPWLVSSRHVWDTW